MIRFGGTQKGRANFTPFATILPYLLGEKGIMISVINLVGNIALLVPIGVFLRCLDAKITWKKTLAVAVASGLAIEGLQALLSVGIFDIDDLILNALGVMIGFWTSDFLRKRARGPGYFNSMPGKL